jgi:NAD(P)-dependent dehydrogenase (short-subunit alcohol dehydrogenase family)
VRSIFCSPDFLQHAGLNMTKVPYRNPVEAANDLAEGRVQAYLSALAIVRPQIEAGKIKPLAVTNKVRAPTAPDVPTVKEAGYPDLTLDGLVGFFGPPEMSNALRERIAADIGAVVAADPTIGQRLERDRADTQRRRPDGIRRGERGATRPDRGDCQGARHQAHAVMPPAQGRAAGRIIAATPRLLAQRPKPTCARASVPDAAPRHVGGSRAFKEIKMNIEARSSSSPVPRAVSGRNTRAISAALAPGSWLLTSRTARIRSISSKPKGYRRRAKLDVASAASAMTVAQVALDAFGRIDALVNNAALYGGLKGGRFDTISESDWDAAMAVNVKGIWNCCKAVVPAIRRAGGGSIVNIASLAATYGMPYGLHYTTSKAAVIGLYARPRTRAWPRQHPGECGGAERSLDRRHARILRGENRQGARYHQDEPGNSQKPGVRGPGRHRALAGVGRQPPGHGPDHRVDGRNGHALTGCASHAVPASRATY